MSTSLLCSSLQLYQTKSVSLFKLSKVSGGIKVMGLTDVVCFLLLSSTRAGCV